MHEIPEFQDDLTFLKRFDPRSKVWKEIGASNTKKKEKVCCNFLLHPKRLSSDSECSLSINSPRQNLTGAILKSLDVTELNNNNMRKPIHCHTITTLETNVCCIENGMGDGDNKGLNKKTVSLGKPTKVRPSTTQFEFDKKFKTLVERSLKFLTNIRMALEEGVPPPDGEEDYLRRIKRLQEFSARFSRIYLYPLLRQMEELSLPEKMKMSVINQKFLYAQQVILQALQAYHTHLACSADKCGSEKLRTLLDQSLYLCHLFEILKGDSNAEMGEFINAFRSHIELLLEALTTFDLKFVEKKIKSEEIKKKLNQRGSKLIRPNKPIYSSKTRSKLSMYSSSSVLRRDLEYKKSLDRKKSNIKSKYKTAGFKHRPPVERPVTGSMVSKAKLFHKGTSGNLKSTPTESPIREDDIKTLVETNSTLQTPPNTRENHENSIASSRQQLVQDSGDGIEEGNVEKALEVLRKFLGTTSENKQQVFLEKIACEVDKRKEEKGDEEVRNDKPKKKLKEPIVTVTGASNAKLICIRDDNSVEEDDGNYRLDKEIMTDVETKFTSSQTQTDVRDDRHKQKTIKISRLPKHNRKVLTMLPKEYAINIIQYKLRYNQFHKHNPMYRKSAHILPWVLMGKISDDILDYILHSVTSELEVNEILENLYNAEFQC